MTDERQFNAGDRVRVRADRTDSFIQPWRDRFAKGRQGTVNRITAYRGVKGPRVCVLWDHRKGADAGNWLLTMDPRDLELAETGE